MNEEELLELIDEKVNEIFKAYQDSRGCTSGDITPEMSLELDMLQRRLADLIIEQVEINEVCSE